MVKNLDNNLIDEAKNGNQRAFAFIVKYYEKQLISYVFKMTKSRNDLDDIIQEVLIKTWQNLKKLDNYDKFSNWMFSIAHNCCIDYLRKNKKLDNDIENEILYDENIDLPTEILMKKELENIINDIVADLPEKQKNVFLLRNDAELSFKDIAEITKEPLNTVLSHYNYAIKKIKKELQKYYE
ncbi:MAG TPA: sigma-70 family RNA polymerase sigma factor [Ignavibacteriales bacterium]|jgi:RNA polymerase sigma-70 factor (ECF subfamily)|nr:sigma-70 family RNA polymerase sigma factor [Ignavibacteriales bacterium]